MRGVAMSEIPDGYHRAIMVNGLVYYSAEAYSEKLAVIEGLTASLDAALKTIRILTKNQPELQKKVQNPAEHYVSEYDVVSKDGSRSSFTVPHSGASSSTPNAQRRWTELKDQG